MVDPARLVDGRAGPPAGLCDSCRFQRVVATTRGSRFSLCQRSREDPAYPRYPRLPVLECAGYERGSSERASSGTSGALDKEIAVLRSRGISPARALQALDVQGEVARTGLVGKVEAALGDAFAGVWFDPAAAQFHIGVTSNASTEVARQVVAQAGLTAGVTITPVRSTWAALVGARQEWSTRLAKLLAGQHAAIGLDAQHNAVSISISSSVSARERSALQEAAANAGVNVLVSVAPPARLRLE
jgi:hypothetical protein